MRLDKFLQVSKLVKRRTVAAELCRAGRILINDKPAKPGASVEVGDRIQIGSGQGSKQVEVLDVPVKVKPGGPPLVRPLD